LSVVNSASFSVPNRSYNPNITPNMEATIPFSINTLEEMLVSSVEKVFSTMLSSPIAFDYSKTGDVNEDKSQQPYSSGKLMVISIVGFIGVANGVVYLYMDEDLANRLTCDFLGFEAYELVKSNATEKQETVNDTMGELANMIVGNFKNMWCDEGYQCKLTIPSIVRCRNFSVETTSSMLRHAFYFKVNESTLVADLLLKSGE